jgi:predicted RNase H-like nuclease (RuvC/YqgF family)
MMKQWRRDYIKLEREFEKRGKRIEELETRVEELQDNVEIMNDAALDWEGKCRELQRKHSELVEGVRSVIDKIQAQEWYRRDEWATSDLRSLLEQEARDD